jgi:hypothetical protein
MIPRLYNSGSPKGPVTQNINEDLVLFKPNYSFEKRQKELAKKKKKEEKKQRKLEKQNNPVEENEDTSPPED